MRHHIFFTAVVVLLLVAGWLLADTVFEREIIVIPKEVPAVVQEPQPPAEITLAFVGDIMLDREVGAAILRSGDWRYPFLRIGEYTRGFDIAFANLETTISDRGKKIGTINSFRSDPRVMEGLRYAGFDVVSVANNHIWDYAEDAFTDTLAHLSSSSIAYAGGGLTYEDAHMPRIIERKGAKFAFLAYTNFLGTWFTRPGAAPASAEYKNWERVKQDIAKARAEADIVVVSYHWGDEYTTHHTTMQEDTAKATIDAGADLVIGHHPHVVQEVEQYTSTALGTSKTGWIAYSLGNFVFDQYERDSTMRGLLFEVTVRNKKITSTKETPLWIGREMQPRIIAQ